MSNNNLNDQENQEIDLGIIFKKIGEFFDKIALSIFKCILFFKKNALILISLIVIGAGLGYFLDGVYKVYYHQVIVTPNFSSTDYLYDKVELIQTKIKEKDTVFLRDVVGLKNPSNLNVIFVKPVADIYKFVEDKPQNLEIFKLISDKGDVNQAINENVTNRNHSQHLISFLTKKRTNQKELIEVILKYLNDTEYYTQMQKAIVKNIEIKIVKNDSILSQIDNFLNSISDKMNGGHSSDKLIYYNENTQLNDIFKTKDALINEQAKHRLELINYDKIIKENSIILNIKDTKGIMSNIKIYLPISFILLFLLFKIFIAFYKNQLKKLNQA